MTSNCDSPTLDKGRNKVYINPNFNRSSVNNNHPMHVNPRFSHLLQSAQPNVIYNQMRIHINPNFVKLKNAGDVVKVNNASTIRYQPQTVSNESNLLYSYDKVTVGNPKLAVSEPVSKSRYSLVRQNTNTPFEEPVLDKPKTTFQLNKYKSIPIKDLKRNLDTTKTSLNRQTTITAPEAQLLKPRPINRKCSSNTLFEEPVLDKPKTTFQLNKYKSIPIKDLKRNLDTTKTSLNRETTITAPEAQLLKPRPINRKCSTNTLFEEPLLDKPKTTFQLNKYKSIPMKDLRKNLDTTKTTLNRQTTITAPQAQLLKLRPISRKCSSSNSTKGSRFKLVNNNNKGQVINAKVKMRTVIDLNKKALSNQLRLHKIKGNLKKNNIPCPMFRKFGKCLRKEYGKCVFLHDKKHVSICRKFIKGLCHDKDCLLSHDLTTKKMPTCYFYLQGTCTKADCPYLHVKLNDKAKVCSDFLKGYCERGSKCLQRHANVKTDKKANDSFVSTEKKYCKLNTKKMDNTISNTTLLVQSGTKNQPLMEKNENNLDRYYQANKGDASVVETYENIKPTRCKLGTLPSFIHL